MINTSTNNHSEKVFSKFNEYINSDKFVQDMKNIIGVERAIVKARQLTTNKQIVKAIYNDDLKSSYFVYNFNDHCIYITRSIHETCEISLFTRDFYISGSLKEKWLKVIKSPSINEENKLIVLIKDYFVSEFNSKQTALYEKKLTQSDENTFLLEQEKLNYATFSIEDFKRTFNLDEINNSVALFEEMNNWENDLLHILLNQQNIDLELLKIIDKIKLIEIENNSIQLNFNKGEQKEFIVFVQSMIDNNYLGEGLLALLLEYIDSIYGSIDDKFLDHEQFIKLLQYFDDKSSILLKKLLSRDSYKTESILKKLLTLDSISHGYIVKKNMLQVFEKTVVLNDFHKYFINRSEYTDYIGYMIVLVKNNLLYFDPEITGEKVYDCVAYIQMNYTYNNKKQLIDKLLTLV